MIEGHEWSRWLVLVLVAAMFAAPLGFTASRLATGRQRLAGRRSVT